MHRRTLLLGVVGLGAAGCSVSDPRIKGTPQPVVTPPAPVPPVGAEHLAGLEAGAAALLTAMAGASWAGGDAARFQLVTGMRSVKSMRTIALMLLNPYFHGTTSRSGAPFWFGRTRP